jgi:hypothetical protein
MLGALRLNGVATAPASSCTPVILVVVVPLPLRILNWSPLVDAAGAVKVAMYLSQLVLGVAASNMFGPSVIEVKLSKASAANTCKDKDVAPVILLAQNETVTVVFANFELSAASILLFKVGVVDVPENSAEY